MDPVGEELKKLSDEIAQIAVRNLNYNAINDSFEWAGWRRLPAIVSASTVSSIEQQLNVRAWLIADRWAFQKPQEVRALEADGSLLRRLQEQEWRETEQSIDPKTGVDPDTRFWLDLPRLAKAETIRAIEKQLGQRAWQIADRWAAGAPEKVKEMEADGTLLERLREQTKLEAETISDARVGGAFSDVPDSEILALHEIPQLPE
jgi:hypothetical protein